MNVADPLKLSLKNPFDSWSFESKMTVTLARPKATSDWTVLRERWVKMSTAFMITHVVDELLPEMMAKDNFL